MNPPPSINGIPFNVHVYAQVANDLHIYDKVPMNRGWGLVKRDRQAGLAYAAQFFDEYVQRLAKHKLSI